MSHSAASSSFTSGGWLEPEVPLYQAPPVPTELSALQANLVAGTTLRTAVLWLSPAAYAAGPYWAAHTLGLTPRHLGREVVAACEAEGTQRVPSVGPMLYKHVLTVHNITGPGGTWLFGLDALLVRLPTAERGFFWDRLWELRQRPPLLLALPEAFRDVGPTDPGRWLTAEPPRGLHL